MSLDKNAQSDQNVWQIAEEVIEDYPQNDLTPLALKPVSSTDNNPKKDLMPLPLVHSDLDEYGFDPYEFRIYAHIVRRTGGKLDGKCFAKLKKTAEICKMSVRKTQYALKTLCDAGLILKEQRKGRSDIYRLAPKSNWKPKEQLQDIRQKAKESKVDKLEDSEEDPTNINE
ncbi:MULTISPECIES: helix-turn-helix domain-containing protein [Kamptonema]|uniref:helix-turn-helix domain-containing protein n=1 Tax=Kamptonema TaxID=1501433 RepID=UPI0001DAC549|nr:MULTISPECIES: helix-turn-helix domain-containing protein [Kamptonema]CBN55459.1 conserved hypothetical protein [Kamptonema sp. PCC 6506]